MNRTEERPADCQPAKKEYEQNNGCSKATPCWQVVAISIVLTIECLGFYLIPQMLDLHYTILYILYAANYVALLFVLVDFFILSLSDPSDPRLKDASYSQPNEQLKHCFRCQRAVSQKSHHCATCNRCVQNFDHHCVFLNNCIGSQNYSSFLRLLISIILHMTISIVIGLILTLELTTGFRWVALVWIVLAALVFLEVLVLALFHCYIGFCLFKTTLQVLRGESAEKSSNSGEQARVESIHPSPDVEDRIVQDSHKPKAQPENPHQRTESALVHNASL